MNNYVDRSVRLNPERTGTAVILGAGFSRCAGLPVQAAFSDLLLSSVFSTELDKKITKVLSIFLRDVFQWRSTGTTPMPELEDIFTCIDLSANTGHQIGLKYTPKLLRAIRRMAIHRIFSILDLNYTFSSEISELLHRTLDPPGCETSFVVLNWDIVLEKHLTDSNIGVGIDYGCDSMDWNTPSVPRLGDRAYVPVCKMHGSSNWLYCENCKALFYDLNQKRPLHSKIGLVADDFRLFDKHFSENTFNRLLGVHPDAKQCHQCRNTVSSHIATFSYRKSFRTHAYSAIWHRAEDLLAHSKRWIFIGYSLPKADFELKSLLKAAELRYSHLAANHPIQIDVVVKGDTARRDYQSFFGPKLRYFDKGLEGYLADLRHDLPARQTVA